MSPRQTKPDRVRITLSTTLLNKAYLEALVRHGTFGANPAVAAERLLCDKLAELRRGDDLVAVSLNEVWRESEQQRKRGLQPVNSQGGQANQP